MHTIGCLPEDPTVIEVRYVGDITDAERLQTLLESLQYVRECRPRVLADFTDARMLGDDPGARLEYVGIVNKLPDLRNGMIAFVGARPLVATDHLQALATARGFRYRKFDARAEAVEWLLGDRNPG